jgi:hypothetical protein
LLSEIHEGICGTHLGTRAIVGKTLWQGFYWTSAQSDSKDIVKSCHNYQIFASKIRALVTNLQTTNLATSKMGSWHNRQIASSSRKISICCCSSGVFHKVDRS